MTVGLTLGKFAPFHKGHQFVVETAIAQTDHVIVLIYDSPEATNIPLGIRAQWLRDLYPTIEVIEAWGGPSEVGNTAEIKQEQENYILERLNGRQITHFFNSEFYGDHVSVALGSLNCTVDKSRSKFPISATEIRENPYEHKQFVSPRVYKDLITNVVFLGAPSTGKTTLAQKMADEMKTVWMPEYGREYWEKNQTNRRLTPPQLLEIAEGHIEKEEQLIYKANKYIFTDTNATTTRIFSYYYHGKALPELEELASYSTLRYDIVFLCENDIPYDDTWDRSGDLNREITQRQIVADLRQRKIPFFRLTGSVTDRIAETKRVLGKFKKFGNITELP